MIEKLKSFVPTNDYVFKRIFGSVGNEMITQGLLNTILDTKVKKIDLDKNTITEKDIYDDKIGILDVKAILNDNVMCDIEMQMINQANIEKRIMFYWSKVYTATIKQGKKYSTLKKTIAILIANFEMKNLKNIPKGHTEWKLRERDFSKIVLTDACEIHIIELPKLEKLVKSRKLSEKEKNLVQWMKFLLKPNELEETDMKDNEAIRKAKEEFDEIQKDEHEQYLADLRMKHIMDSQAIEEYAFQEGMERGMKKGIEKGIEKGIQKGLKKGKEEGKKEIAKEMLKNDIDIEVVIQCTGLTKDEIKKLSLK